MTCSDTLPGKGHNGIQFAGWLRSLCPLAGPRHSASPPHTIVCWGLKSQDLGFSGQSGVHSEFQARKKKEGRRKNINPVPTKIP